MGTRDVAERELIQGVIKLAAAFVHAARGNPYGVAKNLQGALARVSAGTGAGPALGIDAVELAREIEARLRAGDGDTPVDPPMIRRVAQDSPGA